MQWISAASSVVSSRRYFFDHYCRLSSKRSLSGCRAAASISGETGMLNNSLRVSGFRLSMEDKSSETHRYSSTDSRPGLGVKTPQG